MSSVLRAQNLTAHGFSHGFSTRLGGVSEPPYASLNLGAAVGDNPARVAENQRRFAAAVGYAPERLFDVGQAHGGRVRVLGPEDEPDRVRQEQADGLVCGGGAAVAVRSADCVPILLADPKSRFVAVLHAGWRGCVAGVVPAGVQALREASGTEPARLVAAIFPHIRSCCFEVGPEVADALAAAAGGDGSVVERRTERPHAALEQLVLLQLTASGLRRDHVELVAGCTCCDAERFFSYRRDGQASGRHLSAILSR